MKTSLSPSPETNKTLLKSWDPLTRPRIQYLSFHTATNVKDYSPASGMNYPGGRGVSYRYSAAGPVMLALNGSINIHGGAPD